MQVVSFKKMRIRTTRRLEITNSRSHFCCLAMVEPEYGGQELLFGGHNFVVKININTNVYCEKSIVSDPLTIEDEVELTCLRSKFVLDSSSNEYEMSVGLSIS